MSRLFVLVSLVTLSSAPCLVAHAQDVEAPAADAEPSAALATIREMALYARYREALDSVRTYLGRDDLDAAQRNAGLEVLATIHIAMRDRDEAEQALQQLYARDPEHRLSDPDASPPVLSAFGRARSNPPDPVAVTLDHEPPTFEERVPPRIEVTVSGEGASAVGDLRLRYRQGDEGGFTTVVLQSREGGAASTRLPLLDQREPYDVEYFVEALAPSGATLATRGTQAEPLRITIPEASEVVVAGGGGGGGGATAEGGDDTVAIVVGVVIGLLLVGGGVTAGILLANELGGPQDGSLGNIELPLVRF